MIAKLNFMRRIAFTLLTCSIVVTLFFQCSDINGRRYERDEKRGKFVQVNDIKMYYEIYGHGKPVVIIHGNEQSIANLRFQISYFSRRYQVIVADSRGHGQSELGNGDLTYEQMADDWADLLNQLNVDSANIIGWSDGGIIGLLLAIHYPSSVGKVAAMGANLQPDTSAVYSWAVNWVKEQEQIADSIIALNNATRNWHLRKQYLNLLGTQPHIAVTDLHKISSPVLILASDKDIIREEHTILMYQNIPQAHLCIFPGATHMIPVENPDLFNQTVFNFFNSPFHRPDTKNYFE